VAELISAIITSVNYSEGALRKKSLLQFIQRTLPLIDISAFPSSSPIPKSLNEPVFLGVFLLIYYFKFDLCSLGRLIGGGGEAQQCPTTVDILPLVTNVRWAIGDGVKLSQTCLRGKSGGVICYISAVM
jgi:hypothetical protein